ncbi:MAG: histidine phosphatase family protein [Candidatus Aenigmarchaeota archaeon]|nr:histidine phosphatase family protein [Candidatus Aenigmarchaeota archaeon]
MGYLVLIRHGDSFWNDKGYNCFTGDVDVATLPIALKKLIRAGKVFSEFRFDIAFTSELYRAIQAVVIMLTYNKVSGTPIIIHKKGQTAKWSRFYHNDFRRYVPIIRAWQLNERCYGKLQGMSKYNAIKKYGKEKITLWRRSYDVSPPGGESLKETLERSITFFRKRILPQLKKGKNVLIGSHGNTLRALLMYLDGLSKEDVVKLEIKKAVPIVYKYENGVFRKFGYVSTRSKLRKILNS